MKTRTLLLLALACGLAILVAGVFLFVGLSNQEAAPARSVGVRTSVGDLDVLVERSAESDGVVRVIVELGGVADPDAADDFRLTVSGQVVRPSGAADGDVPPCGASTVEPAACALTFPLPDEPGSARVLALRRGTEQVRWDLTP